MLRRQYGIATPSSLTPVAHPEDTQPNERINKRRQNLPPRVVNTAPPLRWDNRNRGSAARGGYRGGHMSQVPQDGRWTQCAPRGNSSWRGRGNQSNRGQRQTQNYPTAHWSVLEREQGSAIPGPSSAPINLVESSSSGSSSSSDNVSDDERQEHPMKKPLPNVVSHAGEDRRKSARPESAHSLPRNTPPPPYSSPSSTVKPIPVPVVHDKPILQDIPYSWMLRSRSPTPKLPSPPLKRRKLGHDHPSFDSVNPWQSFSNVQISYDANRNPIPPPSARRLGYSATTFPERPKAAQGESTIRVKREPSSTIKLEDVPMAVKLESPSPSPVQSIEPTRQLVKESRTLYPLPASCQKSDPNYKENRRRFAREKTKELSILGLKRTKAILRDDGLVLEWSSPVPVWSDTLLPNIVEAIQESQKFNAVLAPPSIIPKRKRATVTPDHDHKHSFSTPSASGSRKSSSVGISSAGPASSQQSASAPGSGSASRAAKRIRRSNELPLRHWAAGIPREELDEIIAMRVSASPAPMPMLAAKLELVPRATSKPVSKVMPKPVPERVSVSVPANGSSSVSTPHKALPTRLNLGSSKKVASTSAGAGASSSSSRPSQTPTGVPVAFAAKQSTTPVVNLKQQQPTPTLTPTSLSISTSTSISTSAPPSSSTSTVRHVGRPPLPPPLPSTAKRMIFKPVHNPRQSQLSAAPQSQSQSQSKAAALSDVMDAAGPRRSKEPQVENGNAHSQPDDGASFLATAHHLMDDVAGMTSTSTMTAATTCTTAAATPSMTTITTTMKLNPTAADLEMGIPPPAAGRPIQVTYLLAIDGEADLSYASDVDMDVECVADILLRRSRAPGEGTEMGQNQLETRSHLEKGQKQLEISQKQIEIGQKQIETRHDHDQDQDEMMHEEDQSQAELGSFSSDEDTVGSAEIEGLALEFLQQYIQSFDSSRSRLEMAYAKNALFSCRVHHLHQPSFSMAGLFAPEPKSSLRSSHSRASASTVEQGRSQIFNRLLTMGPYQFCPRGIVRTVYYDVGSPSISVGGGSGGRGEGNGREGELGMGIILTVHGEVVKVNVAGPHLDHVLTVDMSFVLRRSCREDDDDYYEGVKKEEGEGMTDGFGQEENGRAWPLVAVSHQMTVREAPLLSVEKLGELLPWIEDVLGTP